MSSENLSDQSDPDTLRHAYQQYKDIRSHMYNVCKQQQAWCRVRKQDLALAEELSTFEGEEEGSGEVCFVTEHLS